MTTKLQLINIIIQVTRNVTSQKAKNLPIHTIKHTGEVDVWLHSFLTSELDGGECLNSSSDCFSFGIRAPDRPACRQLLCLDVTSHGLVKGPIRLNEAYFFYLRDQEVSE